MTQDSPVPAPENRAVDDLRLYPAWLLEQPSAAAIARAAAELERAGHPEQPLLVWRRAERRRRDHSGGLAHYVVTGRRYLWAARAAGVTHLPVVYRRARDAEDLEPTYLKDCLAHDDMSVIGRAHAHQRLKDLGQRPRRYALKETNTSPAMVTHLTRFTLFPEPVKWLLRKGTLSFRHGKALYPFAEWPRMLTRLALATVEHDWTADQLAALTPATFGLRPGHPEPPEWPDPGQPPFGAGWRPLRLRQWVVAELTEWIETGRLDAGDIASLAGGMLAELADEDAVEAICFHAPDREEEALRLAEDVDFELDLRKDGRRDAAARAEAMREVYAQWLRPIAATNPLLAWRIGTEAFMRWATPDATTVWLPPRVPPPEADR